MKKFILVIFGIAMVGTLTGCETLKGVGQDIENTGRNLQELLSRN